MIFIRLVLYTFFCIVIMSKDRGIATPAEDLVEEYYTTILKPNDNYLPEDEKDAQAIMKSDRKEEVIAGILSYRDKIRRFAINQRMLTKIEPYIDYRSGKRWYTRHYWVSKWYAPQRDQNSTYTFMDLCFGLLEDENVVLGQYLENFFDSRDETWIVIGMVLAKDMAAMITTYDKSHRRPFRDQRNDQRQPFKNMLRVWIRHNRDVIETTELNHDNVVKDANVLKAEYDRGDWHEKSRDQLELILMKKSIKYARAVIAEFEKIMGQKKLEDIINSNVNNGCDINKDLANAYASLARYIKDKYNYIVDILLTYNDGLDHWAAWIMCIAVIQPQEWPKVDQIFKARNKGQSLKDFILQRLTIDKVMAEMIAIIVDPKFKPTKFSGKPDQGNPSP